MIISALKPNNDNYKLDEITCFEKPLGIVLDSYKPKLSNAFYMYMKFCNSYLLNCEPYSNYSKVFNIIDVASHVIKAEFNLELRKENPPEDIHQFIQNELTNYNRVLVPGNLKELYYSEHYKSKNWPHIFLICGFDAEKRLYHILDYTQLHSNDVIYKPFMMEYETLENVFNSYCNVSQSKDLFIVTNPNNIVQFNVCNIVYNCLLLYENNLSPNPYILLDCINSINDIIENNDKNFLKENLKEKKFGILDVEETTHYMFNHTKYKNIFFSELVECSRSFIEDTSILDCIIEKKDLLITKWNNLSNMVLINMKRVLYSNYENYINEILTLELEIKNLVLSLKPQLSKYMYLESIKINNSSLKDIFIIENDNDSVITINKSNVNFNFIKAIEYNCWTGDNSPKLIVNSNNLSSKDFTFISKVSIIEKADNCGFLSGIMLKFNNNSTFHFGISSQNTLIIDERLKSFGLIEIPYTNNKIYLKVVKLANHCDFYYTSDLTIPFKNVFTLEINHLLDEIGLSCKTWTNVAPINIEFSNIEFSI